MAWGIHNAGHNITIEKPRQFLDAVLTFLKESTTNKSKVQIGPQ